APEALRGWEWHYLDGRLDDSLTAFGRAGERWVGVFDAAGARAVGLADGRVVVWDAASRARLGVLAEDGTGNVFSDQTAAGARLFLAYPGELRLVDLTGRRRLSCALEMKESGAAVASSADGMRIAVYSGTESLALFDGHSGRMLGQ